MKTLKSLSKLIIATILLLVAYLGLEALKIVLLITNALIILVFNRDSLDVRLQKMTQYLYNLAYSYDQTANAAGYPLFNVIMKTKEGFLFGNPDQPISYAIAKNWVDKTLTKFGLFWANFLIWVDYGARRRGSNHLEESIKNTEKVES